MDLSVVIPAYNEAAKIPGDIRAASAFLTKQRLSGEIIVVDDGSTDDTADAARKTAVPENIALAVLSLIPNRGKGFAIRSGILKSAGDIVLFADSGVCVPFDNAITGMNMIRSGQCDIAHGSRKHTDSTIRQSQNPYRKICSSLFRFLIRHYMNIPYPFTDTQCGFKLYRGDIARELYAQCNTEGFMFDIEIILRAAKRRCRICEFPVEWTCDPDSRLSPAKSSRTIIAELNRIKHDITKTQPDPQN